MIQEDPALSQGSLQEGGGRVSDDGVVGWSVARPQIQGTQEASISWERQGNEFSRRLQEECHLPTETGCGPLTTTVRESVCVVYSHLFNNYHSSNGKLIH